MSVIITNRNKPKDCLHCWNHYDCDNYLADPVEGYIDKNCPLKSVDVLIEKIEKKIEKCGKAEDVGFYSEVNQQKIAAFAICEEIIKEYCGMEPQ